MTQGIHRGLGVAAVCFLVIHIAVKVSEGHATMFQVFLPAGFTGQAFLIFLGTFASYTMILAAVTGALRSAFAERRHPVRWRILHCTSYASWCTALIHGLNAGRSAKTQFVVMYVLALVAVAIALVIRMRATRGESLFPLRPSVSGTGGLSPQGSRGRSRRAEPTQRNDGVPLAYTDPLPPLPNFPPVAPPADSLAGLPPVYAQPLAADATAQLPPVPDQGPQYPQYPQYVETPPYGTQMPPQEAYGEPADVSAERLQPVNWQQPSQAQSPGPYYNGGQR
jgi:DMSO/TMAO reductase YedYZ heme-binding membrane subunit